LGGESPAWSTTLAQVITVRTAAAADLAELVRMYSRLEEEMGDLHEMWPVADGLDQPIIDSLAECISSERYLVHLGLIDEVPLGFAVAELGSLLMQADGEMVGIIDLIYTEPEARDVGIAEAVLDATIDALTARQASRFDARVLPGHRRAKNFFERSGFSARSITMHRRPR
jgi:ribosomal protein S18 acetylase RimI-like enzyme